MFRTLATKVFTEASQFWSSDQLYQMRKATFAEVLG